MPQPLSKKHRNVRGKFYPGAMAKRPQLAVLVAQAIATWASLESQLARILILALGGNAGPAWAMLNALSSTQAQTAALNAALREILPDSDHELLAAVMLIISQANKVRNRLAHHVWGFADELPDSLLLVDPRDMSAKTLELSRFVVKAQQEGKLETLEDFANNIPQDLIGTPPEVTMVYDRKDLLAAVHQLERAHLITTLLRMYCMAPGPTNTLQRPQLLKEPEIQEALVRIRRKQKSE